MSLWWHHKCLSGRLSLPLRHLCCHQMMMSSNKTKGGDLLLVPLGCEKEEEERVLVSQGHIRGNRILYTQGQKKKWKWLDEICPSVCKRMITHPPAGVVHKNRGILPTHLKLMMLLGCSLLKPTLDQEAHARLDINKILLMSSLVWAFPELSLPAAKDWFTMVNWLLRLLLCAVRGAAGSWGADSALFIRMSSCATKHH